MNFIDKLERKFPRFGISNLMKYVIIINVAGVILMLFNRMGVINIPIYARYLSLDFNAVFNGQVWRLLTFVLYPAMSVGTSSSILFDLLLFAIWAMLYYTLGTVLEQMWGKFRFTLFYIGGVIMVMLITLGFYLYYTNVYGSLYGIVVGYELGASLSLQYINEILFLAYAAMFPNAVFNLYFIIPIKAKWMGAAALGLMAYQIVQGIIGGGWYYVALIVGALVHLALFFLFARGQNTLHASHVQKKRKRDFNRRMNTGGGTRQRPHEFGPDTGTRHKCAICGRTEKDDARLEFRYCSKCNGNYEYCSDHLFSHEHVR